MRYKIPNMVRVYVFEMLISKISPKMAVKTFQTIDSVKAKHVQYLIVN